METNKNVIATYAAYSRNHNLRMDSSSGAIFSHLAEIIIIEAGVVYGVAMTDDCSRAEYVRINKIEDLGRLRGSKYMQAFIGNTFASVKKDLDEGILVMFSGTGCQINGLKAFLGKDYSNLLCVDIICHGVPSQKLWEAYHRSIENKYGSKVVAVNFRDKKYGWSDFGIAKVDSHHQAVYRSKNTDPYMLMFLRDFCLRPSCYECHAKTVKKADVTLADFWGVNKVIPRYNDGLGISLVILRTEKGKNIFDLITDRIENREISYEQGIIGNKAEYQSAIRPQERDMFYKDMNSLSFEDLSERYAVPTKISVMNKMKRIVKRIVAILTKGRKFRGGYDKLTMIKE